ncbi:MAG: septum formation initiator family protein [Firmicutes bacterium]|nr:septum formation initiator family protein [Bacillota bacterium]
MRTRRRVGTVSFFLFLFLLGYLAVSFSTQFVRLQILRRDVAEMRAQVAELQRRNAAMREELQRLQSPQFIEQVAREKLGLVKPGETTIVPQGSDQPLDYSIRD